MSCTDSPHAIPDAPFGSAKESGGMNFAATLSDIASILVLRRLHNARIYNAYRNRAVSKYAINEMAELST